MAVSTSTGRLRAMLKRTELVQGQGLDRRDGRPERPFVTLRGLRSCRPTALYSNRRHMW